MDNTSNVNSTIDTHAIVLMAIGVIMNETKESLKMTAPQSPNKVYFDAVLKFADGMVKDSIEDNYSGNDVAASYAMQNVDITTYGEAEFSDDVRSMREIIGAGARDKIEIEHQQSLSPSTVVAPQTLIGKVAHAIHSFVR